MQAAYETSLCFCSDTSSALHDLIVDISAPTVPTAIPPEHFNSVYEIAF